MIKITSIVNYVSSVFSRLFLVIFILTSFSGCGWLKVLSELTREVFFSASINPGQIYEGQQAKVSVKINKDYGDPKSISWKLEENGSGNLAASTDFVETQGSLVISGTSAKEFTITSKPGSISSGSKSYKLIMTAQDIEANFDLTVLDSGSNSTIAITSAQNSGFVNAANQNSYTVNGVCSTSGSEVNLIAEIGGQDISGVIPCDSGLTWSMDLDFTSLENEGAVALTATHAGDGGTIASTTLQVTKDTVTPRVAITSPASLSYINAAGSSSFTVSGTCSDNGHVVTGALLSSGGGAPVAVSSVCSSGTWSATANATSLADDRITASFDHADIAGNSINDNRNFNKDTLVPTIVITAPASMATYNASNYNSLSIVGTCNKTGATITLSENVSGTLTAVCDGSNFSFSGLTITGTDGSKNITLQISDSAGNSSQDSLSLVLDVTLPVATLSGKPESFDNDTNLNVTVGGADVSQYLYKFGDAGSTDCSNAVGYSSAIAISILITDAIGSDGAKRLCVRGKDANGNIQDLSSATSYDGLKTL